MLFRSLREHAIAAGLAPNFVVLDQAPATRMQREAAEAALDEMFAERPSEMRRLMEAVDLSTSDDGRQDDLAAALLKIYDAMRTAGVEEIPANVQASGDAWARARELAVHWKATSWGWWAEQFLALTAPPTWTTSSC